MEQCGNMPAVEKIFSRRRFYSVSNLSYKIWALICTIKSSFFLQWNWKVLETSWIQLKMKHTPITRDYLSIGRVFRWNKTFATHFDCAYIRSNRFLWLMKGILLRDFIACILIFNCHLGNKLEIEVFWFDFYYFCPNIFRLFFEKVWWWWGSKPKSGSKM